MPRRGFIEDTGYAELAKNAKATSLRAMIAVAYAYGSRRGKNPDAFAFTRKNGDPVADPLAEW